MGVLAAHGTPHDKFSIAMAAETMGPLSGNGDSKDLSRHFGSYFHSLRCPDSQQVRVLRGKHCRSRSVGKLPFFPAGHSVSANVHEQEGENLHFLVRYFYRQLDLSYIAHSHKARSIVGI
jgi:hypothetical protein